MSAAAKRRGRERDAEVSSVGAAWRPADDDPARRTNNRRTGAGGLQLQRPARRELRREALLDLFDPGLERGDLLLQLAEVPLEDLSPAAFTGESGLDPAQRLRDRVVLLLESLESPVELVEVPEHLLTQLGDLLTHFGDLLTHFTELAVDRGELATQEFDELRVLGRGHGFCLSHIVVPFKCLQTWTGRD
jgi:hypothetical protein